MWMALKFWLNVLLDICFESWTIVCLFHVLVKISIHLIQNFINWILKLIKWGFLLDQLYSVIYKIISKCLANHMPLSMNKVISYSYCVLLPYRIILDNVIIYFQDLQFMTKIHIQMIYVFLSNLVWLMFIMEHKLAYFSCHDYELCIFCQIIIFLN